MCSKKDYEAIAQAFQLDRNRAGVELSVDADYNRALKRAQRIVDTIASYFEDEYESFDRELFLEECGYPSGTTA